MSGEAEQSLIVMGVMGSGKSTIGALLAAELGMMFIDGDDFHPASNKAKMAAGIPLNDDDRAPWLQAIGTAVAHEQHLGSHCVVACSALRHSYRDILIQAVSGLIFVHLEGDFEVLATRIRERQHEFMSLELLQSQLDTLEPLSVGEPHILSDITKRPEDIISGIVRELGRLNSNSTRKGQR